MHAKILPRYTCMCTKFGVDSSSRFSFSGWTHTHSHRFHWSPYPHIGYCQQQWVTVIPFMISFVLAVQSLITRVLHVESIFNKQSTVKWHVQYFLARLFSSSRGKATWQCVDVSVLVFQTRSVYILSCTFAVLYSLLMTANVQDSM